MKNFLKYLGVGTAVVMLTLVLAGPVKNSFGTGSDPNDLQGHITNTRVNVASASSTTVLSANSAAKYRAITNNCNYSTYGALGATASKAYGFRLNAQGGTIEFDVNNMYKGAITMIASTSDGTDYCKVTVLEAE